MRNKLLKLFISLICIMALILPLSYEVIAKLTTTTAGTTQSFGISLIHESKVLRDGSKLRFGYRVNSSNTNRNTYRIYAGDNDYETTIICLQKDGKFPTEDSTNGNYQSLGKATAETLAAAYSAISADKATGILWLINNAVLPEDSDGLKDIKLSKIFKNLIDSTARTENAVTLNDIKKYLTEDDLVFAYQCAVWQTTQNTSILNSTLEGTSDGTNWDGLDGNDRWGYRGKKGTYIREIINYYINHYNGTDNIVPTSSSNNVVAKITKPTATSYEKTGSKIYVGPFKIEPSVQGKTTYDYVVNISFKDKNGNNLYLSMQNGDYILTPSNTGTGSTLKQTKEDLEGKNFYIALPLNTRARTIDIELPTFTITTTSTGTVWKAVSGENMQPLLSIERTEEQGPTATPVTYTFDITTHTEYDVALRKYIATVYRKNAFDEWAVVYNGSQNGRTPTVVAATDSDPFNQYYYNHRKDPVEVQVGDRVVYGIVLYNEGKDTVRIKQIIDHLPPSGLNFINSSSELKFTSAVNAKCTKSGNNIVYSDSTAQYIYELDEGEQSNPIYLEFEVTEDATGKVVTNIAEITEMADSSGNPISNDIDSAPNSESSRLPSTEQAWEDYKGYNNKDELNDSNYYYKGYEDDDDFEKIKVPGNIDLALRKSITTINGEQKNRAKAPDTTPLTDGNSKTTTSTFSDIKTPVQVKVGDVVIYTIRVFNEGDVDGYASKVEDYIPEGLGFILDHNINYDNQWAIPSSVNRVKLSTIPNATGNLSTSDFSRSGKVSSQDDVKNVEVVTGKVTISTLKLASDSEKLLAFDKTTQKLDIHEVQVACVVLEGTDEQQLRNIAAITEYRDKNKNLVNPDIESSYNNDLSNFNESSHEDDEDFEKLVLKQTVYDLALKKYVTSVKDATNNKKTIADGQKRNLQVVNTTALDARKTMNDKADAVYSFGVDKAKAPVQVEQGDSVVYTIRVYNEGLTDAVVEELVDSVPEGLSFIPAANSSINQKYGWETFSDGTATSGWKSGVKTTYLKDTVIPAYVSLMEYDGASSTNSNIGWDSGLSYAEVQIEFKVTTNKGSAIKNIAEITKDDGDDNDSIPNNINANEDDEDFDVVIPMTYDLALKKYVSSLSDATNNAKRIPDNQKRTLQITDVTALENRASNNDGADATYSFGVDKQNVPVVVEKGDSVIYTIRIYNEGLTDAKVGELIDSAPTELTFLPNSSINTKYGWTTFSTSSSSGWTSGIKTEYLKNTTLPAFDSSKKNQTNFNESTGIGIDHGVSYAEIKVEFKVNTAEAKILRNISEITKDDGDDDDSSTNNMDPSEDDEDFDVIIPVTYDLALKKFVSSVSDATNQAKRIPDNEKRNLRVVDVTNIENRGTSSGKADAEYSFGVDKVLTPVRVQEGDNVVYTIRVYNEGRVDAKVQEIKDTVFGSDLLIFLTDSAINKKYGWERFKDDNSSGWTEGLKTEYFKNTIIKAFDPTKKNQSSFDEQTGIGIDMGVSYVELKIEFKVATSETFTLENIAEITKDDGDDSDSNTDNGEPEEDDQDLDFIVTTKFDLALRKFITQIDDKEVKDRVPTVDTAELDDEHTTTAKYSHTKEPKVVVKDQTVIYTIRVYNEGTIDGYAAEIKDDIPKGLTYLPNHDVNKEYGWKMYDSNGNETQDVSKAVTIRTAYGARNTDASRIIQKYDLDVREGNPDYLDVKVAFKVSQESVTDGNKIIINTAEISKETDEDGNQIEDTDSKPDDNIEDEDDIDKEYLQLKYFDLSLLKYVSKVIVTENGVTKETNTGYNGNENPEPVVKVEINKKNLANTQVKYVYSIKVTNEGEIEGYAKEVKDRIPKGLAFYEEDNKEFNWKIGESGVVTTDHLANKLLQPGESAVMTLVLRWENSESNLGQKVNTAEISKDENPYGVPDIDSKPDNNQDGEDDQDEAIAVISITTGSAPMYIALVTMIIAILGAGFYLIYKYVVKK